MKPKKPHIVYACMAAFVCAAFAIEPADPDLISEARNILSYLESIYQKKMISAIRDNTEAIITCSGKAPVIIEEDLCGWNAEKWGSVYKKNVARQMDQVKNYYEEKGGIPALCFHWPNPLTEGGRFPDSQENLTLEQFNRIVTPGTSEYNTMIDDLNKHADYLKPFSDENIPLLWRPLHEIDGGWFWWTCREKPENTAKLWKIVFDHLVNRRGFHNLIWVYSAGLGNPQGSGNKNKDAAYRKPFYPGADYVDISGIDIYEADYANTGLQEFWNCTQSYQEAFDMMEEVTPGKMLALTECQAVPNMDKTWNDDPNFAKWLWALPWWANGGRNPCSWIEQTYDHEYVISVADLPDFSGSVGVSVQQPVPITVGNGNTAICCYGIDGRLIRVSERRASADAFIIHTTGPDRITKQLQTIQ